MLPLSHLRNICLPQDRSLPDRLGNLSAGVVLVSQKEMHLQEDKRGEKII